LSYEVSPNLVVGGSLDYVWAMMDLKMAMTGGQFGDMVAGLGGTETYGSASGGLVTGLSGALTGGLLTGVDWAYFNFSDGSDYTGKAKATGWAGKLGIVYKVSPKLNLGFTYHSKTSLSDMTGNAVLSMQVDVTAPGDGALFGGMLGGAMNDVTIPLSGKIKVVDFQWPETIGFGMSYQVNDKLMVAADFKRINWADVMENFQMTFTADNVAANGAFAGASMDATLYQNWDNQDVFMFGLAYKATDALTLRAGANFANNPIPNQFMNPLFPAIEKEHFTAGVGYALSDVSDVNFSLQHAPKVSQTNAQGVTVDHSQTSWQLMYSKRF
jgi:long-chain fatty acid transport protein